MAELRPTPQLMYGSILKLPQVPTLPVKAKVCGVKGNRKVRPEQMNLTLQVAPSGMYWGVKES